MELTLATSSYSGARGSRPGRRRRASSWSHGSPVRSTAMADVGNFVEMRSAAVVLLPSAVGKAESDRRHRRLVADHQQGLDIGSEARLDAVDLLDHRARRRVVEPVDVVHRRVDAGPRQGLAGAGGRRAQHRVHRGRVCPQPIAGQRRPPVRPAGPAAARGRPLPADSPTWRAGATAACGSDRSPR